MVLFGTVICLLGVVLCNLEGADHLAPHISGLGKRLCNYVGKYSRSTEQLENVNVLKKTYSLTWTINPLNVR